MGGLGGLQSKQCSVFPFGGTDLRTEVCRGLNWGKLTVTGEPRSAQAANICFAQLFEGLNDHSKFLSNCFYAPDYLALQCCLRKKGNIIFNIQIPFMIPCRISSRQLLEGVH